MKLIDAIKHKGNPYRVPNCSRDELPKFFVNSGFKVGAEIGVFKGDFIEKFCKAGLTMYGIDPWTNRSHMFQSVRARLRGYKNCTLIRKTSMEAVIDFQPRSLDFVYIDADHRFPSIAEDIYNWFWRVKRGGVVSGHDYLDTRPGEAYRSLQVQSVVDAFVKAFYVDNLYIFGRSKAHLNTEQNDRILSFMFFRK